MLAVAGGAALHEALIRLRRTDGGVRLDRWAIAGALLIGIRVVGYPGYPLFDAATRIVLSGAVSFQPSVNAGSGSSIA